MALTSSPSASAPKVNTSNSYRQSTDQSGRTTETITQGGKVTSVKTIVGGGGSSSSKSQSSPTPQASSQPSQNTGSSLADSIRNTRNPQPQSVAELLNRANTLRDVAKQTGQAFTQQQTRQYLGGAVQGTNVTYSRVRNTPEAKAYLKDLRAQQAEQSGQVNTQSQESQQTGQRNVVTAFIEPKDALSRAVYRAQQTAMSLEDKRRLQATTGQNFNILDSVNLVGSATAAKVLKVIKDTRDSGELFFKTSFKAGQAIESVIPRETAGAALLATGNAGGLLLSGGQAAGGMLFDTTYNLGRSLGSQNPEKPQQFVNQYKEAEKGAVIGTLGLLGGAAQAIGDRSVQAVSTANKLVIPATALFLASQPFKPIANLGNEIAQGSSQAVSMLSSRNVEFGARGALAASQGIARGAANFAKDSAKSAQIGTEISILAAQGATRDATRLSNILTNFAQDSARAAQVGAETSLIAARAASSDIASGSMTAARSAEIAAPFFSDTLTGSGNLFFDANFQAGRALAKSNPLEVLRGVGAQAAQDIQTAAKNVRLPQLPLFVRQAGEQFGENLNLYPVSTSISAGIDVALLASPSGELKTSGNLFKATQKYVEPTVFRREVITPTGERFIVESLSGARSGADVLPVVDAATGNTVYVSRAAVLRKNPALILETSPPKILSPFFRPSQATIAPQSTDFAVSTISSVTADSGVLLNKPTFVSGTFGTGVFDVNRITQGATGAVGLGRFRQFPEEFQQIFLKAYEQRYGRPASAEVIEKVFSKRTADASVIEAERLFKVAQSQRDGVQQLSFINAPSTGKKTTSGALTTADLVFQNPEFSLFRTRTASGEILPEAAQNVGNIEGILKVRNPKIINEAPVSEFFGGFKPKPTSQKAVNAIAAQQEVMARSLPTRASQIPPSSPIAESKTILDVKATALLPRTSESQVKQTTPSLSLQPEKARESSTIAQILPSSSRLSLTSYSNNQSRSRAFEAAISSSSSAQAQSSESAQRSQAGLAQALFQKKVQQNLQLLRQANAQGRLEPLKPLMPFLFPVKLPSKEGASKARARDELLKGFEVFIRSRGKDILAGSSISAKEAGGLLSGRLKSTLSASGFVVSKRTGEKLSFSDLGLNPGEFGLSKGDSRRVVQKRGFRLGTRSEVKDIQFFRRKKNKKSIGSF